MAACGDNGTSSKSVHGSHEESCGASTLSEHVVSLASQGFGTGGENYDANRPGYTEESVNIISSEINALVSDSNNLLYHALELGAGTGKLTELLVSRLPKSIKYLASDPSGNFLDVLKKKNLNVDTGVFAAANIPLPEKSVKNVVCAQCFHWFAEVKEIQSIHRVLAPGGKLILLWNAKNFQEGWMKLFYDQRIEVFTKMGASLMYWFNTLEWQRNLDHSPYFKLEAHHSLPGVNFEGDLEKILSNLTTVSAYNTLPSEDRDKYIDQLRQALKTWPSLDINKINIPFTTELYIYKAL
ncbi:hypothetical protein Bpfe_014075 [Biomphalaria pfeifferi]|uniref:Methyltransferase type 11 domain-containing protein n=1 Tax=Biomphalaria pfeifferi TaxID=112525 RepID=A0AAD8BL01_BIOPF|nr:hypothetical protein Bpfe_014075 [Biomphalaria pfeifferi]